MKFSFSLALIALIGISSMQAASAQETRGARFNFAPNTWKAEGARLPKGYGEYADPAHNVRSGSVPKNDILGVDPLMLSKPALPPPMVTASATPRMMVPTAVPQMMAPSANGGFNPAFGKPQLAHLPVPQQAMAMPMVPVQAKPAAAPAQAAKPQVRIAQAVRARLQTPKYARPAVAQSQVASYPTNYGYTPSSNLTRASSGGTISASTAVHGTVILPKRNR